MKKLQNNKNTKHEIDCSSREAALIFHNIVEALKTKCKSCRDIYFSTLSLPVSGA